MKQDQFTLNWYHWLLANPSQWTILEPLYYSSFFFATPVYGVIGYRFCWLLPHSRSTSWTWISWDTNWAWISSCVPYCDPKVVPPLCQTGSIWRWGHGSFSPLLLHTWCRKDHNGVCFPSKNTLNVLTRSIWYLRITLNLQTFPKHLTFLPPAWLLWKLT